MSTLSLDCVGASPWGRPLLTGISVNLEPGGILALAGPNGAGKSSLLGLMAGDLQAQAGSIKLNGRALGDWPARERARQLAFLPQLSLLNFPYTVEEVVLLGRIPHAAGHTRDCVVLEEALAMTDTGKLRHRLCTQLSGGEKQRTQLARVFAQLIDEESLEGKLLLLDEPTSALDLAHQRQILQSVRRLAGHGCAVVLAIHDLNLAASIADRMMLLEQGRQAAVGTPAHVVTPELIHRVFGLHVLVDAHPRGGFPVMTPADGFRE